MTRFSILGPLAAEEDGEPVALGGPKQRALLAALLIADCRPVSTDQLVQELWGSDPPATAAAALQVYVSGLRKLFGTRVRRDAGGYAIEVMAGELDATEFTRLVDGTRKLLDEQPAEAAAKLDQALTLWQGEPLSGGGDGPAVQAARLRLAEQRLTATEDRIDCELALGNHHRVVSELAELVVRNPLRERLTEQLMLALYRAGRTTDAEDAYRALAAELDDEPSDRLTALAAAIRRRDPTLDPPLTLALPVPASRFIGRRRELDRIEELLGQSRMLTLVGPGGTGKTRLALQLARDLGPAQYPDGVYFIELAGSAEDASVTRRVAAAIGARELPGESLTETLVARLRYTRALVVLDNCEHLVDPTAALTAELLRGCAGLRLLTTSREPLGVAGEMVVPVDGLRSPATDAGYADAIQSEALRLLADRGAAARAGFRIEPTTVRSAIAICRRLDGLPLAIEIAAARLRVLTLPELEKRLDRRLDLHLAESRARPPRHRTIRATIEWSHDLLDKDERALFRRLAVFAGGFTLAAAERVGADPDGDIPHRPADVLDLLTRLVHRSLVVPDLDETTGRYRMLETVGEFAAEQLAASTEEQSARQRHADWYQRFMADAPPFGSGDHTFWVDRVPDELDNLRAAMEWTLRPSGGVEQIEQAVAIAATPLWWHWWNAGQMTEGREWLRRVLDACGPAPTRTRATALRAAAALARNSGDLEVARRYGEEDLAIQQRLGDSHGLAQASNSVCMIATAQGDFDAALEHGAVSRRQHEIAGDHRGVAWAANNTGMALRCMGRFTEAEALHREALELHSRSGDQRGIAVSTYLIAFAAARQNRPAVARELYLEALARYRDLQMAEAEIDVLEGLACLDVAAQRPADALARLLVAERERRRIGVPVTIPDEVEMVAATTSAARAALDRSAIGRITEAAAGQSLADAVDAALSSPGDGRRS